MKHAIKHRGDVFRHEVAGAGGLGDPLERDAAMGFAMSETSLSRSPRHGPITVWYSPGTRLRPPDFAADAERYDPRTSWPLISPALLAAVWMLMYHLPLSS